MAEMANAERPVPCPKCTDKRGIWHGMIAIGYAVQYCMCPGGRERKKMWFDLPEDLRAPEEAICPTIPDLEDLNPR
jgi:hypothetical protein